MLLCSSCLSSPHPFKGKDLNNRLAMEEPVYLGDTGVDLLACCPPPTPFLGTEAVKMYTLL